MGYPVGLPPGMAYYSAVQGDSLPYEIGQQGPRPVQASIRAESGFPVPTQPAGALHHLPRDQEGFAPYIQAPQLYGPSVDIRSRRPRRGNTALALLGGAIAGLILGDVF